MDICEIFDLIRRRQEVFSSRGIVVFTMISKKDLPTFQQFLDAEIESNEKDSILVIHLGESDAEENLQTINRERDLRVRAHKLILIVASSFDQIRNALRIAPDLLSCPDLRLF